MSRKSSIFQFIIIFALVYMGTQTVLRYVFPDQYGNGKQREGVFFSAQDKTVKGEHHPVLVVDNKTDTTIELAERCPMPPVDVWRVLEDGTHKPLSTDQTATDCAPLLSIPAQETVQIDLAPWKYSLFSGYGIYEVELPVTQEIVVGVTDAESQYREGLITRFSVYEPGTFTQLFRTFISKPLLNLLVFIASLMPDYNLGFAILILTLLVKLVLFIPTQHAMEGQRKMQAVQPKMDEIKKKYKDNPKKLQEETMRIWKENKVNPMQSCLPMLIQFPVLIGLFFVIRDGSVLALSQHLLYEPYQNLLWSFGMNFFGLDLTQPSVWLMPPLLMVLQFAQMKLSFAINEKKKQSAQKKSGKKDEQKGMSQQEVQQRVMMYGLPLMIGFFALQFPAAVSLYWLMSTMFAIGQQVFVNRKEV